MEIISNCPLDSAWKMNPTHARMKKVQCKCLPCVLWNYTQGRWVVAIFLQHHLNDINRPHRNHLEQCRRKMEKFKSNMNSKRCFPVRCKIYQSQPLCYFGGYLTQQLTSKTGSKTPSSKKSKIIQLILFEELGNPPKTLWKGRISDTSLWCVL